MPEQPTPHKKEQTIQAPFEGAERLAKAFAIALTPIAVAAAAPLFALVQGDKELKYQREESGLIAQRNAASAEHERNERLMNLAVDVLRSVPEKNGENALVRQWAARTLGIDEETAEAFQSQILPERTVEGGLPRFLDRPLSKHFMLSDLTQSEMALRVGIRNIPDDIEINNLQNLARNILDPIHEEFGEITVMSGFRVAELNRAIGGQEDSQHALGEEVDIKVVGQDNAELACWIKSNLVYDSLSLDNYLGRPNSGWVSVSYKTQGNRNRAIRLNRRDGDDQEADLVCDS